MLSICKKYERFAKYATIREIRAISANLLACLLACLLVCTYLFLSLIYLLHKVNNFDLHQT